MDAECLIAPVHSLSQVLGPFSDINLWMQSKKNFSKYCKPPPFICYISTSEILFSIFEDRFLFEEGLYVTDEKRNMVRKDKQYIWTKTYL